MIFSKCEAKEVPVRPYIYLRTTKQTHQKPTHINRPRPNRLAPNKTNKGLVEWLSLRDQIVTNQQSNSARLRNTALG